MENHSEFHDQVGPVHSGSGDINIYANAQESVRAQARGRRRSLVEDLQQLHRQFVPPPNLGSARTELAASHILLLTGPAGSGRRSAARMLLHEISDERTPVVELDDEAADPEFTLPELKVGARHRYVLDLSGSTETVFAQRHRELPAFRLALQQADARLIVVVPDSLNHHVDAELSKHAVRIGRPDGAQVLRRHLEAAEVALTDGWLDEDIRKRTQTASMSEIAKLAQSAVKLRSTSPASEISALLHVAAILPDRRDEVIAQVKEHGGGRPRAVLFAAAMCAGATSDAVFFSSHRLVAQLAVEEAHRFEQDGHHDHVRSLDLKMTADNRIEFARIDYDRAVREYFWDSYPDLRKQYCTWVDQTVRDPLLDSRNRQDLVDRAVAEALRTNSPGQVRWLIERWVFPTGNAQWNQLRDFGVQALIIGLTDERHGWFFRRMIYDWSRSNDLPPSVGQILVSVCVEVIAPRFPSQALVRLHHRARREDGSGNPTARQALAELTRQHPMLWLLLLDRLAQDINRGKDWPADLHLFLDLADPWHIAGGPQPLITDAVVRGQLVLCWYKALLSAADPVWNRVCDWLTAAAQCAQYDALLGILVDSAYQNVSLLGSLHVVARDWSASPNGRPEAAVRLSQLIDMAQGLQATDYAYDRMPEEAVR
ncbi:hypothetical protein SAMN02982929_04881 [Saccharopolyspora kobensis]|uniref:Uncharacterized protein n=1 Tax=Saccharopolyspora kobensis TaxID=146035 RepID=A0A1H6DSC6_9PSEU|nr:ATP-binding protein [Saccharopolyspora kobensis]SEG87964.1 hypothetical protein SAMN02982929_04881 [Saccharopolyspora kobensis]SFE03937.1 hypothetical protein SAMN05216506_108147 [Saccharopolyspora kobensis]